MRSYRFKITGVTALLMHADSIEAADRLNAWRKDPTNKNVSVPGDDRSPAWTWMSYLYTDGKSVCMPSENVMACLRTAATQLILKKQKTYKEISQSGMMVAEEFCEFSANGRSISVDELKTIEGLPYEKQCDAVRDMGFRLWAKRAKISTSKHIRVRPRFDDWAVTGTMQVAAPEITKEILSRMFQLAGNLGICDWRPSCKSPGPYGRFIGEVE